MLNSFILYFIAIFFTAVAQILLKTGSEKSLGKSFFSSYFNFYSILGYVMLLLTTLITLYALKEMELKFTIIFMPFLYIFIGIFSYIFFNEEFSKRKFFGSLLIILGIIIFNIKI